MESPFGNNTLLAQQLKLGNSKAYDFLMDSLYKKLCAYAYTLTKNHDNAEDIVQNVFVEIWVNRKNINPSFSITSYFYKSVYNGFIDQYRKNQPVIYLEKKYLKAVNLVVQNEQDNLEELMALVNLEIEKLPSKCKQIFLLSKKEGLSHTEISEYLNISLKTVEGHITRAFKILGKKLGRKILPIIFLLFDCKKHVNKMT
ncbi:RNA polymerase sigma-70 factor (ECF subfamily) [Maribacter vaceletii]|uniref:RNA polymerase sigma-70 factor (ECF subfamily) n=1 Tax=Maribacter vaceletii TaxID=1206816 RepID=A0A495DTL3_9FLAO|nr:RNA polymerase sigma-70 factor [Maribacter vaceletii]RKR07966.1 RNA polymerase sigma-70 factor (ECF subfamily) [Maribacter vaceletii]